MQQGAQRPECELMADRCTGSGVFQFRQIQPWENFVGTAAGQKAAHQNADDWPCGKPLIPAAVRPRALEVHSPGRLGHPAPVGRDTKAPEPT